SQTTPRRLAIIGEPAPQEPSVNTVRELLFPGVIVFVTALIGVWLSAESRAQTASQAPAAGESITGAWTLDRDASDPAPTAQDQGDRQSGRRSGYGGGGMGRHGRGGYGGGMGRGGYGGAQSDPEAAQRMRDAMHDYLTPPDRLTIVQTDSMIVITTGDGRVTR